MQNMSHWVCCNSCFKSPGPERQLAVTNCGHIICSMCFQKDTEIVQNKGMNLSLSGLKFRRKEGECLICSAKCHLSPLSDKSSSEVKALFSDINTTATRYLSEISKVLQFQARHQRRLLTHYQQKNEKMKETFTKMQQEMQQMSKKITEQKAYISKLEVTLRHQSTRVGSQSNRDTRASNNCKPGPFSSASTTVSSVLKIPYSSPVSLSCQLSSSSLVENIEGDRKLFPRKTDLSGSVSRLCLISPPQNGRMGTVPHRATSQSTMGSHSVRSATVSREFSSNLNEPMLSSSSNALYRRESPWETPVFKLASAYKYPSMSSLGPPQ